MPQDKKKTISFFRKVITELGFQKTEALVREVTTEMVIEEIEKKTPLRSIAKKFDISVPTISTWIKDKIPKLKRGRRRLEESKRTFKKSGIDEIESGKKS